MPEIMLKIREDLGPDAVILKTNEIKQGGFLGFFQRKKLEVVATLDSNPIDETIINEKKNSIFKPRVSEEKTDQTLVLQELQQLKNLIHSQHKTELNLSPDFLLVYNYLVEQEVEENLAYELIETIEQEHTSNISLQDIVEQLRAHIAHQLQELPSQKSTDRAQIIHFVGPTGVGKTTTLAKIASDYILNKQKKIAFITTDTYRIAAIDQLKTYAKILNVPVKVAYSLTEYEEALQSFATYDLVFVDTAGRNFRDPKYIKELERMHHFHDRGIETYLVLSLTAKKNDMLLTYDQFQHLPIEKVIFTKLDETGSYGNILNISVGKNKPIAYITNGQNVPDDIITPNREVLSDLLVSGYGHA